MFKNFNIFFHRRYFYVVYPGSASTSGIRIWNTDSGCGSRRPKSCGFMRMRMRIRNTGFFFTPGSGICFLWIPDPTHTLESLVTGAKKQYFGLKILKFCVNWLKSFSVPVGKKSIFSFVKLMANSFLCLIWDPGWKIIWIRDPDKHPGSATLPSEKNCNLLSAAYCENSWGTLVIIGRHRC